MKTPTKIIRGLGATHHGTEHHWMMRMTSVLLVPLVIAFIWIIICALGSDYQGALDLVGNPIVAVLLLLFVIVGGFHMHSGVQTITEDYLQNQLFRTLAKMGNTIFSLVACAACVFAVLKVSFGG
ncbi:succinate dehydrogenase, hydrophobic membrane anchor protein [uncultured Cohaesibacter sp.]|uniref:succinate dehydrogenase, hydrophobic membrane anchor protein n=1 Tax=uncultured Cohaesibacter sp. TaxID=1002546 RepID=UPI0029C8BB60|nr:succinate dehydrogenase, hydrophobic membrane anchor protein [uncultured Cohaesibacter sp.]